MKHNIIIYVVALLLIQVSCTIETSDNGDLDGLWYMVSIDTLDTAGHFDVSQEGMTWAVQMNLMHLHGGEQEFYIRFSLNNDILILSDMHQRNREKGDPKVTEELMPFLQPYGINQMEEQMTVAWLDDKEMTLMTPMLRLKFRKY